MLKERSEKFIIFLVGAIHFINILDFMIVMPLGPDFAVSLGISTSHLGLVGGSYTAAAAVAGIIGSVFLDRFDRRSALVVTMVGLIIGTAAGGFATNLGTLLAARIVAGLFGGPTASLSLSIIADIIPPHRRGRAMGAVMTAFSLASVLGVPAGLELARIGGWHVPFFAVAGLGLVIGTFVFLFMPPMRHHLDEKKSPSQKKSIREPFMRPVVLFSMACTATVMMATFSIVPNLSTFFQYNAGYPREKLGLLYMAGGLVSFVVMRVVGVLVDRWGAAIVAALGTVVFLGLLSGAFLPPAPLVPAMVFFVSLMVANSFRAVPLQAISSRVPAPSERARFLSTQSAVSHIASSFGAFLSTQFLYELPNHSLGGMGKIALFSMTLAMFLPFLLWQVESLVKQREMGMVTEQG